MRYAVVMMSWLSCFVSFLWAMQGGFFRSTPHSAPAKGTRIIKSTGIVVGLAQLAILGKPRPIDRINGTVGVLLYWSSFLLFWSCIRTNRERPLSLAFCADEPKHLVTDGPYRYVRHPFYLSYLLAWSAGPVVSKRWWLGIGPIIMGIIYHRAARFEEAKFLHGALAQPYESYGRTTGMFLPRVWAIRRALGGIHHKPFSPEATCSLQTRWGRI
jgi:protein-S-isoprenylcysteine O-methyltransferase Ste14